MLPRIIIAVALFYLYARLGLIGTTLGLVIGHTILAAPYVVITVMAVLKTYDERLDHAACSLGAEQWRTLATSRCRRSSGGLIAAFLFAFITSFDELTIALFITGGGTATLPRQMWNDLLLQVNPTLAAVSTRDPALHHRLHHRRRPAAPSRDPRMSGQLVRALPATT